MSSITEGEVVEAYLVDVLALEESPEEHLRAAWARGALVIAVVDGAPRIVVETIEDLEAVHRVANPTGSTRVAPFLSSTPPGAIKRAVAG